MIELVLDGREITGRADLHRRLQEGLRLPWWYGRNLDALFDCLTDLREETTVRLLHRPALRETLGPYADRLDRVLCRAQEENPCLHWQIVPDED